MKNMSAELLTKSVLDDYKMDPALYDEIFDSEGQIREHYKTLLQDFSKLKPEEYKKLNDYAKISFFNQGVTFAVYSEKLKGTERIFPFDLMPRIIAAKEWQHLETGLIQRNLAI